MKFSELYPKVKNRRGNVVVFLDGNNRINVDGTNMLPVLIPECVLGVYSNNVSAEHLRDDLRDYLE